MMTEPSILYEELSQKYNLSPEIIKEAVLFFWNHGVKTAIQEMVNQEIYINKLGSFKVKEYKIKYAVAKAQDQLKYTTIDLEKRALVENALNKLSNLQEQIQIINQEKNYFNEFVRKDSRDIQEQAPDLGGTEEQSNQEGAC